jgi:hypothetical protein
LNQKNESTEEPKGARPLTLGAPTLIFLSKTPGLRIGYNEEVASISDFAVPAMSHPAPERWPSG